MKDRWLVKIMYATDSGIIDVVHDIEELEEVQSLVERGPDWRAIHRIEIELQRFDRKLTVEEAAKL